ncbi:hypothetical protein [Bacillus altitudinis]
MTTDHKSFKKIILQILRGKFNDLCGDMKGEHLASISLTEVSKKTISAE